MRPNLDHWGFFSPGDESDVNSWTSCQYLLFIVTDQDILEQEGYKNALWNGS